MIQVDMQAARVETKPSLDSGRARESTDRGSQLAGSMLEFVSRRGVDVRSNSRTLASVVDDNR